MRINMSIPVIAGKYLNCKVDLKAKTVNGEIVINIINIIPETASVSKETIDELKKLNLMDYARQNAAILQKMKSLEITNGNIVIVYN